MKAIVMAGGEGTRLRPLTADMPKPMAPIMGRSVLEHMLRLLRKNGVDKALITLGYMASAIEDWAATRPVEGLEITCRREDTPLGTAGSVLAAGDWLAGEDFLVVSGDAVCDFDLRELMHRRRRLKAEALLLLTRRDDPGEYGSVICAEDGRVLRFAEKPRADKVTTDLVNTGIYALSGGVLDLIPKDAPADFGRDVFPAMAAEGRPIYAIEGRGYWCDVGSIPAYLSCCRDALEGRVRLDATAPLQRRGVYAFDPLPAKATLLPPVYIGRGCVIEAGAVIGPNAILEDGSTAASGARVTNSVVMGAALRRGALVGGSWLGRGAVIGERAIVSEGCAVGSGCVAGACSLLEAGTRLWPRRDVPPGERVGGSFEDRPVRGPLRFGAGGVIRGEWNAQISPEAAFALGCAAAGLGSVAVACCDSGVSQLVAASIECGIRAGGADAVRSDADHEWAASQAAPLLGLAAAVFVREKNGLVTLSFFGADGRRISRDTERRLEAGAAGSLRIAPAGRTGALHRREGLKTAAAKSVARHMGRGGSAKVTVEGPRGEKNLLLAAVGEAGLTLEPSPALLRVEEGGFALTGRDEEGRPLYARDCAMLALLSCLEAGVRQVTLPDWAPRAARGLADSFGAELILEENGEGEACAHYMAAHILAAMKKGQRLCDMARRLPPYSVVECEVPVPSGAAALRRLRQEATGMRCTVSSGLWLEGEGGCARVCPAEGGVRISAECRDMEAASELCAFLRGLVTEGAEG